MEDTSDPVGENRRKNASTWPCTSAAASRLEDPHFELVGSGSQISSVSFFNLVSILDRRRWHSMLMSNVQREDNGHCGSEQEQSSG